MTSRMSVVISGAASTSVFHAFHVFNLRSPGQEHSWRHVRLSRVASAVQNSSVRALLTTIIIAGQLTLNAVYLSDPASFCTVGYAEPLIDLVVWLAWNTLLLIIVVESHGSVLIRRPDRQDGSVWDEPITVHWPKLLIWIPFTGTSPLLSPAACPLRSCIISTAFLCDIIDYITDYIRLYYVLEAKSN